MSIKKYLISKFKLNPRDSDTLRKGKRKPRTSIKIKGNRAKCRITEIKTRVP